MEIDQWNLLLLCDLSDFLGIRFKTGFYLSIPRFVPLPASQRRDKDRLGANRLRFVDVPFHVAHEGGHIGRTPRFAWLVIVTELDQVIVSFQRECICPKTFFHETHRTPSAARCVGAFNVGRQKLSESRSPT